jgi:hypothetical protein
VDEKKDESASVISPPASAAPATVPQGNPKNPDGTIDKQAVHDDFMASEFVEWAPYAASRKLHPQRSRSDYPVAYWVLEKRRAFTVKANEELADLLLRNSPRWQKDVIDTLERYPRAVDAAMHLTEVKIQAWFAELKKAKDAPPPPVVAPGRRGKAQPAAQPGPSLKELDGLTTILSKLVSTKYKSLLLADTVVKLQDIVQSTEDANKRAIEQEATDTQAEWSVQIMGSEALPAKQLTEWISSFYDKAQRVVDPLLDPEPEGPGVIPPLDPEIPTEEEGSADASA